MSKYVYLDLWKSLLAHCSVLISPPTLFEEKCTTIGLCAASPLFPAGQSPYNPQVQPVAIPPVVLSLYPLSTGLVINTTTKLIKGLSIIAGWESRSNKSILVTNEEEI